MNAFQVQDIIDRHEPEWLTIKGVLGAGSKWERGVSSIVVYVKHPIPDGLIPSVVEGVPVSVEEPERR